MPEFETWAENIKYQLIPFQTKDIRASTMRRRATERNNGDGHKYLER